ncbi:APC family permease [Streptomyces sp. PU-14G]|uniref:APC family permease n=1 Tax=Streptomyces sp. PU-14G TaxID=2800808 RepID=UPI0034DFF452
MTEAPARTGTPARTEASARAEAPASAEGELRGGAIGLPGALGVTLSNMAPVNGAFLTAPAVVAAMGTQAPWAFLLTTFGLLATALTVGQFARRIVSAGGPVAYAYHAYAPLGPRIGVLLASAMFYVTLLSGPLTIGGVAVFAGSWMAASLNLGGLWWMALSLAVLVFGGAVVLRGVVESSRVAMTLAVAQFAVLIGFSVLLLVRSGADAAAPLHAAGGDPGGLSGLSGLTFPLAVAGMIGWDNSASMAAEIRRPRRVVPLTLVASVALVGGVYALTTWAGVAGYAHWQGAAAGTDRFGDPANGAPFLELAAHFAPFARPVLAAFGAVSSVACLIAATTAMSRITFTAARAGMLPRALGRVSTRRSVPTGAAVLWLLLIGACVVLPALVLGAAPTTVSAWEAGIGTVPVLISLFVGLVGLPVYLWRTARHTLRLVPHVLIPLVGLVVIGWGVYGNVRPDQPAPGNLYWIWTGLILLLAVVAAVLFTRRPAHLRDLSALGIADDDTPELAEAGRAEPVETRAEGSPGTSG